MKIARINDSKVKETYALVSDDGKRVVTRQEIQEQTGVPIPPSIKDFMFRGWLGEVEKQKNNLLFKQKIDTI